MAEVPSHLEHASTVSPGATSAAPGTRRQYGLWATVAAVGTAVIASLCCVGPLLFVALGIGAGLASTFEPFRPLFTVLTLGLLAMGFRVVYGRKPAAALRYAPDGSCAVPRSRGRDVVLLWAATLIALALLTFPRWSQLLV